MNLYLDNTIVSEYEIDEFKMLNVKAKKSDKLVIFFRWQGCLFVYLICMQVWQDDNCIR